MEATPYQPQPTAVYLLNGPPRIRVARFEPNIPARGTVLLINGAFQCLEFLIEVVDSLLAEGYVTVAFDWRGHGGSDRLPFTNKGPNEPALTHIDDFSELMTDLTRVVRHVVSLDLPRPLTLLGGSTGGQVAVAASETLTPLVDGYVLMAPALRPHKSFEWQMHGVNIAYRLGLGRIALPALPIHIADVPFAKNIATHSETRWARARHFQTHYPRIASGLGTVGWVAAQARSIALTRDPPATPIDRPILVLMAEIDTMVDTPTLERFAATQPHAQRADIAESYHAIFGETDKIVGQATEITLDFLRSVTPHTAPRPDPGPPEETTALPAHLEALDLFRGHLDDRLVYR